MIELVSSAATAIALVMLAQALAEASRLRRVNRKYHYEIQAALSQINRLHDKIARITPPRRDKRGRFIKRGAI